MKCKWELRARMRVNFLENWICCSSRRGNGALPEANPKITTANSQQKRIRSPKIICRKQRREKGWDDSFSTASEELTLTDQEAPIVPPAPLYLHPSVWEGLVPEAEEALGKHWPSGSWWWRDPASGILEQNTWHCTSPAPGQRTWAPPPHWCWWAASPWSPAPGRHRWCWGEQTAGSERQAGAILGPYSTVVTGVVPTHSGFVFTPKTHIQLHLQVHWREVFGVRVTRGLDIREWTGDRKRFWQGKAGDWNEGILTWWHGMAPQELSVQNSERHRPWRCLGSGERTAKQKDNVDCGSVWALDGMGLAWTPPAPHL